MRGQNLNAAAARRGATAEEGATVPKRLCSSSCSLSLSLSVRRCQMREQHFVRRRQRRDARRTDLQQRCPPPRRRRVVASFDFIGEILRAVLRVISVYNSVNESAIWQTAISFKTDREGGGRATGSHAGFR